MEQTLSIIKPDAVSKNQIGNILSRLEKAGLKIAAMRMVHLSKDECKQFYAVHAEKPFYDSLTEFMSEGPIVVSVLEAEDAIALYRKVMGATNPAQAEEGTIRKDFATSIERNAVHGSDAPETARTEIAFFFKPEEICSQ